MKVFLALIIVVIIGSLLWFGKLADVPVANQSVPAMSTETGNLPVISRQEILHATDLVTGVKQAVAQDDEAAINSWLNKAIELAKTAQLSQEDMTYLQSKAAFNYVVFHAKRSLFNDAFEQAYYAIEDIEPLKTQYPQAQDLFAKADQLVMDRNSIIQKIAAELANGNAVGDEYLRQAKQLWQQRFVKPTAPSL
ncbi:hypothetical protein [Paraglaciecola sp.]|uniref:hypothetical protein n=1 Tax=Paraglaciecola sp. TaxID=1920173 RepID=UPI0030F3CBD3